MEINMETSPYVIILRLIIRGAIKQYEAKFEEGLNLIWGDMDSGKSSILNLIDYCLGGKNDDFLYGEMRANARVAFLEVDLNGNVYTFERDILSERSPIRVYSGVFEQRDRNFPLMMTASSSDDSAPDGWVSDFILDNLGIAKVTIKESKYRDDADSDRLSFRDLMKLMYLKQTRVGSDALLNYQSPPVFNKNVEIQKFVFNVYDGKLAALNSELSRETNDYNELEKNERFIRKFLHDVKINIEGFDKTREEAETYQSKIAELDENLEELKSDFVLSSNIGATISAAIKDMRAELSRIDKDLLEADGQYANYAKLSNTYRFDLEALKLSKISRSIIAVKRPESERISCPLCQSKIPITSPSIADEDVEYQLKSLKNRNAGIQTILSDLRERQRSLGLRKEQLIDSLKSASRSFDENQASSISPLLTSIQAIEDSRSHFKVALAEVERNLSIYNKYADIGSKLEVKSLLIEKLRRAIKIVKDGLIEIDWVIDELSGLFASHIQKSGLQKVHGAYIDKKFVGHFRDISYYNTSSGGVRTITSIALFVTRLQYLLKHACNLPTFLMIDTPGQNIGRHRTDDDNTELSDPKLYENIFNQIVSVVTFAASQGRKCQIIVVDNDLPDSLKDGKNFHLVKRFSKQGGKFEKGLINDA
jgi:DNA repair exonuclease SbcCD ATPase subunit